MKNLSNDSENSVVKRALVAVQTMRAKLAAFEKARSEPLAIVGMGCRFPGGAENIDAYWKMLEEGRDGISEVPAERWQADRYFDPDPTIAGKMSTRTGGFLTSPIDAFDASFFGIAPSEARHMDPQQRILLEVTWEALERAGIPVASLRGSHAGVFVGVTSHSADYWLRFADPERIGTFSGTGTSHSVLAGRLSYLLDVDGPSLAIDTACSSSLVAAHYACRSLRLGECDLAIVGGVNLMLSPHFTVAMSRLGLMADRCKTFDRRADGYVRGEGCGVVLLKRLSAAREAGDPILAVIRGSAVVQDGRTNGISAPNGLSQQKVLLQALQDADLEGSDINYVEAHGTGTALGDPIEIEALSEVYGLPLENGEVCTIGAVKSNIGHLEGAAGVAGLIKTVLALRHGKIPKNLHFESLNPHISLAKTRLEIAAREKDWNVSDRRRAGVSSFGWSGTNAHVILEEAPAPVFDEEDEIVGPSSRMPADLLETEADRAHILPLSARDPEALQALASAYLDRLCDENPLRLPDVAFTAGLRRDHHEHRLAVVGSSVEDWTRGLEAHVAGRKHPALCLGKAAEVVPRPIFVYSGQGCQWIGMGRELLATEPLFRRSLEAVDEAFQKLSGWSLISELETAAEFSRLTETEVAQPTIFALQVALSDLWRSWGITPAAVVGHSVGEIAAAHVAGVLSLDQAVKVVYHRSRLMQRQSGSGKMVLVALAREEAERAIDGLERISVAAVNAPSATVLAGDAEALEAVIENLGRQGIESRWLRVEYAFHSPQMDPILGELATALADLAPEVAELPLYSTVEGRRIGGAELDASYWCRNVRQPVLFNAAITRILEDEIFPVDEITWVEIGAHPVLAMNLEDTSRAAGHPVPVVGSLRRDEPEREALLRSVARLYGVGHEIRWAKLIREPAEFVSLPTYCWQRRSFWLEDQLDGPGRSAGALRGAGTHPLVGVHQEVAGRDLHLFELYFDATTAPYLLDHRVQGMAVLPAAASCEIALAAARQAFGEGQHRVENLVFEQPLLLPEEGARTIQVALASEMSDSASFMLSSRASGELTWTRHTTGTLRLHLESATVDAVFDPQAIQAIRDQADFLLDGGDHTALMKQRGLDYGPAFQGVRQIWLGQNKALAEIALGKPSTEGGYLLHPSLLDGGFQVLASLLPSEGDGEARLLLPTAIGRVESHRPLSARCLVVAELREVDEDLAIGDVRWIDEAGNVLARVLSLQLEALEAGWRGDEKEAPPQEWTLDWRSLPILEPAQQHLQGTWWVFTDASDEHLVASLRRAGATVVRVHPGDELRPGEGSRGEVCWTLRPSVKEDFARLSEAVGNPAGVIYAWPTTLLNCGSTDALSVDISGEDLAAAQDLGVIGALHLAQTLTSEDGAAKLWLITRGAWLFDDERFAEGPTEAGASGLAQAPMIGFGRVLAQEFPALQCRRVDLDPATGASIWTALGNEILAEESEDEIALRLDAKGEVERLAPRLVPRQSTALAADEIWQEALPGRDAFRLEVSGPGGFDQLKLSATTRREPGAGEVEIEVVAAGLNFSDIMKVLGTYPGLPEGPVPIGIECAGRVVAIGPEVKDLQIGDEVIALGFFTFGSFVTLKADLVAPKPCGLDFALAATLPVAYATAAYALLHLGRMQPGERVLIHSASGGVGLAAVALAQAVGAEIYATAGTEAKRQYLRELGIAHVMDSRSLDFVDQIRDLTGGEGIDLILNSLVGEAIPRGLSLLRPLGRFLEIGKRDIYGASRLSLLPFQDNLSFYAIDLDRICRQKPALLGALLRKLQPQFENGELKPLPLRTFALCEAQAAFRTLSRGEHIGKLVLMTGEQTVRVAVADLRSDALAAGTYLITGGLGALGIEVAFRLADLGARRLVLAGRSCKREDRVLKAITALHQRGVEVLVASLDVTRPSSVEALIQHFSTSQPPLRGVVHAAGVLDDALLADLSPEQVHKVMAPKMIGAWNLHRALEGKELDLLVFFSSAAALLGTIGQANYAAANAFLDALARWRTRSGQRTLSIAWGPWAGAGMAEAQGERLARRGLGRLSVDEGLDAFARSVGGNEDPWCAVMPFEARRWQSFHPAGTRSLLADWRARETPGSAAAQSDHPMVDRLRALEPEAARESLIAHLRDQLAQVMGWKPEEIEWNEPLGTMGVGSLQSTEFRNSLESSLGLRLPSTLIWRYPTLAAIADHVGEELHLGPVQEENPERTEQSAAESAEFEVPDVSEDEFDELLARELATVAELTR